MLRSPQQLQTEDKAFTPCAQDRGAIRRWIDAAVAKVADSELQTVSLSTRFEAVYDAIFNMALVVLNAQGWKDRGGIPGHHAHVLEGASAVIGASEGLFYRIDAMRTLRNQKYDGIARSAGDLEDARRAYEEFSAVAATWLQATHPALLR